MKPNPIEILAIPTVLFTLSACGGTTPAAAPAQAPETSPTPPAATEPEAKTADAAPAPSSSAAPAEPEPTAEKCEGNWVCVKVSFETKKVEMRETKLLGDPKIEETWSKTSDGRPVSFDAFSKGPVELTLRRKPGDKNEVVVKLQKGAEIVVDRHDGSVDDFTHVGAIATEQGGELLLDLRYMK